MAIQLNVDMVILQLEEEVCTSSLVNRVSCLICDLVTLQRVLTGFVISVRSWVGIKSQIRTKKNGS